MVNRMAEAPTSSGLTNLLTNMIPPPARSIQFFDGGDDAISPPPSSASSASVSSAASSPLIVARKASGESQHVLLSSSSSDTTNTGVGDRSIGEPLPASGIDPTSAGPLAFRPVSPGVTCQDKQLTFRQSQRRDFWVLENYLIANKSFRCNESITYTTHGDFSFMDNLEPLLERWQGPVSLAVYAPGDDFARTVRSMLYYRDCRKNTLVRDFVTFHVFFNLGHIPATLDNPDQIALKKGDCSIKLNWGEDFQTYKKVKKLTYPVNIARNVARLNAQTHFVFPSDIELYPSPGLIPQFLSMVKRDDGPGFRTKPRVYVNSIFEIHKNTSLPNDKAELVSLLNKGLVIPFHKQVCPQCHSIPYAKKWLTAKIQPALNVFRVGKRHSPYQHWEPIYIGTNQEPLYDERLTWEGRSDKMLQGYKLCVMDYEFHILDNAFLIHRPGIKTKVKLNSTIDKEKVSIQTKLIRKSLLPQAKKLYGERKGCEM